VEQNFSGYRVTFGKKSSRRCEKASILKLVPSFVRGKAPTERDPMARFSRMDAISMTSQFQRRNPFQLWRLLAAILG